MTRMYFLSDHVFSLGGGDKYTVINLLCKMGADIFYRTKLT